MKSVDCMHSPTYQEVLVWVVASTGFCFCGRDGCFKEGAIKHSIDESNDGLYITKERRTTQIDKIQPVEAATAPSALCDHGQVESMRVIRSPSFPNAPCRIPLLPPSEHFLLLQWQRGGHEEPLQSPPCLQTHLCIVP